ncbi:glycosyltransferase [Methylophilus sp. DW102]|uniref:glycosyltransferase n=1 Tax=Methylophilus sp. DW102 TaxID=3095607 RepID=UPI00308B5F46|nr:glycosyltransferase [Methylophilus sp. DW102]
MATIDVLLPVKNGKAYLTEAIESIIQQSYADWRLIVLDHGSDDGSYETSLEYARKDSRVQVFQFLDAVGLSGLLNKGLELCDCQFVMRHDADDIALPDRMKLALAAFKSNPGIDVVGGHAIQIDAKGNETGLIRVPTDPARLQVSFFFKNPMIHPATMIRFSAIKAMGIRYGIDFLKVLPESERLKVNGLAEDYYLFGQLGIMGKCMNLDEYLIKYRWHGENVGAKKAFDQITLSLKISRYLAAAFCTKNRIELFDPAPFCTYSGTLINLQPSSEKTDLLKSFNYLSTNLVKAMGQSDGLARELAFRSVLTTRNNFWLLVKFLRFKLRFKADLEEWYAIKSWITRYIKKRPTISIDA